MVNNMPNYHSNISFGLVSIPVILNSVIKNNDTSFNMLHKKCLSRIRYIKYCPHCKKEVKESDIIKGYEYEKDNYITLDKNELSKLKPENDGEIEIISFINISEIDPIYFEKSYILNIDKSKKAFNLFCEAIKKTKKVALAKTVIGSKFYYAIIRFDNYNLIMSTLYFEEEVNIDYVKQNYEINEKELDLAVKLINESTSKFEPLKYKDEYQNNIKHAINEKINGKTIKGVKRKTKNNVSDLLTALEKSLNKKK